MTGFRNQTWEQSMLIHNLQFEFEQNPELKKLNSKLNKAKYTARNKLKALAEKHDIKLFMNNSDKVIRNFRAVTESIPYHTSLRRKAENILDELKSYSHECWFYCQGDTRKSI